MDYSKEYEDIEKYCRKNLESKYYSSECETLIKKYIKYQHWFLINMINNIYVETTKKTLPDFFRYEVHVKEQLPFFSKTYGFTKLRNKNKNSCVANFNLYDSVKIEWCASRNPDGFIPQIFPDDLELTIKVNDNKLNNNIFNIQRMFDASKAIPFSKSKPKLIEDLKYDFINSPGKNIFTTNERTLLKEIFIKCLLPITHYEYEGYKITSDELIPLEDKEQGIIFHTNIEEYEDLKYVKEVDDYEEKIDDGNRTLHNILQRERDFNYINNLEPDFPECCKTVFRSFRYVNLTSAEIYELILGFTNNWWNSYFLEIIENKDILSMIEYEKIVRAQAKSCHPIFWNKGLSENIIQNLCNYPQTDKLKAILVEYKKYEHKYSSFYPEFDKQGLLIQK